VSLTARERAASSALIFYPFIRFSTKWMLQTLPKKHPMKLAIMANVAQANAIALDEAGLASDLRDYGNVLTHDAEGEADWTVNTGRAMPGMGPLLEMASGLAEGERTPAMMAAGSTGPITAGIVSQAFGLDPYTGEKSNKTGLEQLKRNATAASPLSRWIGRSNTPNAQTHRKVNPGLLETLGLGDTPTKGPLSALREMAPDLLNLPDDMRAKKALNDQYEIIQEQSSRSEDNARAAKTDKDDLREVLQAMKDGEVPESEAERAIEKWVIQKRGRRRDNRKAEKAYDEISEQGRKLGFSQIDIDLYLKRHGYNVKGGYDGFGSGPTFGSGGSTFGQGGSTFGS
jgi:hypothetical protein